MIRRFDAGESIMSDDDEIVELVVKAPLDQVVPVRLTANHWNALYAEARELGIGPTTLARMWLLEKLRAVEAGRRAAGVAEGKTTYAAPKRKAAAKKPPSATKGAKSAANESLTPYIDTHRPTVVP